MSSYNYEVVAAVLHTPHPDVGPLVYYMTEPGEWIYYLKGLWHKVVNEKIEKKLKAKLNE